MPIVDTDIKHRLTTQSGASGETTTSTPASSIGKYASTTDLVDNTTHNLFDVISGDENAASTIDYRCVAILNKHASLTWRQVKAWISAEVAGGAVAAIGLDPAGVVASTAVLAASPANETTAPASVTFTAPTTKGTGLSRGDVANGQGFGLWIRRTAQNNGAVAADGVTYRVEGDTDA